MCRLCTIIALQSTAQNSSDNLPSYATDTAQMLPNGDEEWRAGRIVTLGIYEHLVLYDAVKLQ